MRTDILERLEEDLPGNLAHVSEIARRNCNGCADYHVGYVALRYAREHSGQTNNRDAFVGMAASHLNAFSSSSGPLEVLIAGAADSGLPAIAAQAAHAAGPGILERLRMTVVDRCATPLELCEMYTQRARLPLDIAVVDLVAPDRTFQADVIFLRSLFRHIAREHHASILKRMADWLKPGGMIMFSTSVGETSMESTLQRRLSRENEIFRLIAEEDLSISEPLPELMARAERNRRAPRHVGNHATVSALNQLFATAGLVVLAQQAQTRRSGRKDVLSVLVKAFPT